MMGVCYAMDDGGDDDTRTMCHVSTSNMNMQFANII